MILETLLLILAGRKTLNPLEETILHKQRS